MELRIIGISPGMVKFFFPAEKVDLAALREFLAIEGVTKEVFNKATKSLFIFYSPKDLTLEGLLGEMKKRIPALSIRAGTGRRPSRRPSDNGYTPYVEGMNDLLDRCNTAVYRMTGGFTDFWTIAPSACFIFGIISFLRRPVWPGWTDLFWYSLMFQNWYLGEARERNKKEANEAGARTPQENKTF